MWKHAGDFPIFQEFVEILHTDEIHRILEIKKHARENTYAVFHSLSKIKEEIEILQKFALVTNMSVFITMKSV